MADPGEVRARWLGPDLLDRPLQPSEARAILEWRYPGRYSEYDLDSGDPESLAGLLDGEHRALLDSSGQLIGYYCLGAGARAPDGGYRGPACDLGLGLRPDLIGRGLGRQVLGALVRHLRDEASLPQIRATIARWNRRALRLVQGLGFKPIGAFGGFRRAPAGDFVVLILDLRTVSLDQPPGLVADH